MQRLLYAALTLCLLINVQAQTEAPTLKVEDRLKIRNVQYELSKKLLEMQRLEARYRELQEAVKVDQQLINEQIVSAARSANIDLTKWDISSDSLVVIAKPATLKPSIPK